MENVIFSCRYEMSPGVSYVSFVLGPGESVIREDQSVTYLGGHSRYGNPMWGKLVLSNKRFLFIRQRVVETGRIMKSSHVETIGVGINLPIEKVIGAHSDVRERKTGTFSKERYGVLIVSLDTDTGVENPVFEVTDTQGWTTAIQKGQGGEVVVGSGARFCKYCGAPLGTGAAFCSKCGKSQV